MVLLGVRVAAAFGRALALDVPQLAWTEAGGLRLLALPHPSGRCRALNDLAVREAVGRLVAAALGVYSPDDGRKIKNKDGRDRRGAA